jgi:hypothetical protein
MRYIKKSMEISGPSLECLILNLSSAIEPLEESFVKRAEFWNNCAIKFDGFVKSQRAKMGSEIS